MAIHDELNCPPVQYLVDYNIGRLSAPETNELREHLQQCTTCVGLLKNLRADRQRPETTLRETAGVCVVPEELQEATSHENALRYVKGRLGIVPQDIREAAAEPAKRFRTLLQQPKPARARFGQIWATYRPPGSPTPSTLEQQEAPRLVTLLGEESTTVDPEHPSLSAAPISLDIEYCSDRDLVISADESLLGSPFMVEVWNEATMLREQLSRYLGELRQPLKRYLGLLYQAQLGVDVDLSPLHGYVGPALSSENDPRFAFQEDESEACEYLRLPLLRALAEAELESESQAVAGGAASRLTQLAKRVFDFPDELLKRLFPAGPLGLQPGLALREMGGSIQEARVPYRWRTIKRMKLPDAKGNERDLELSLEPEPGVLHVEGVWEESEEPAVGVRLELLSAETSLGAWVLGPNGEADFPVEIAPDQAGLHMAVIDAHPPAGT